MEINNDLMELSQWLSEEPQQPALPAPDHAVDHLDPAALGAAVQPSVVASQNLFPLILDTQFKKKYYRFDNKLLQCFPGCDKYADVREARLMGLEHRSDRRTQAWCTGSVQGRLRVPPSQPMQALHIVGRFLAATPQPTALPGADMGLLSAGEKLSALPGGFKGQVGAVRQENGFLECDVSICPSESWLVDLVLPRHRRNAQSAAHKVPLFCFEMLVLVQTGEQEFTVCSRMVTAPFEIASVRTLIREVLAFRQNAPAAVQQKEEPVPEPTEQQQAPRRRHYSSTVEKIRASEASRLKKKMNMDDNNKLSVLDIAPPTSLISESCSSTCGSSSCDESSTTESTPDWLMMDAFSLPTISFEDDGDELIPC